MSCTEYDENVKAAILNIIKAHLVNQVPFSEKQSFTLYDPKSFKEENVNTWNLIQPGWIFINIIRVDIVGKMCINTIQGRYS